MRQMTPEDLMGVMLRAQKREREIREKAQKEYASEEDAFYNFRWVGKLLGLDPEVVLMVYLLKHIGGIASWTQGHKLQRESVQGRIDDARVYLTILDAMAQVKGEEDAHDES